MPNINVVWVLTWATIITLCLAFWVYTILKLVVLLSG
jgi:hypothetical protein